MGALVGRLRAELRFRFQGLDGGGAAGQTRDAMHGAEGPMVLVPILGGVFAVLCLWAAYRSGRKARLIENLPTCTTQGVFIGLVELKGTAESTAPLTSFLAAARCVYFDWRVEEHWSRTVRETYRDSQGKTRTRTRRESGWTTVANGGDAQPFYLKDEEGVVLVRPDRAKIEAVRVFEQACGRADPLYYAKGPRAAVMNSDHRRRFVEQAIPLHQAIYVMGKARERQDIVAPEIAHDSDAPIFLISTRTEAQIRSSHRRAYWGWTIFGLILLVASLAIFLHAGRGRDGMGITGPVLGAVGYGLAAAGAWVWLAYNSLIDLRQRVRRAWSQVEVQLKRRNDLIPNLVEVVKALRSHEAETQSALADLRMQLGATPPGEAGPDHHGLGDRLLALRERYPELKASQGFEVLQRSLADTENRIALARGYFNEIATHFNTRLQTVPERYVSQLAGMKPKPLMAAAEFERAPVKVTLAD
jgi:hypothetical protein